MPHLNGDGGGPPPPSMPPTVGGTGPGATGPGVTPSQSPAPAPAPAPTSGGTSGGGVSYGGTPPPTWQQNYPAGALSEMDAILELFQFATGYVWTADQVTAAEQALAQSGLYTQGDKAFAFLFNRLSSDQQAAMPWAEFGLGETDYLDKAGKAKANWYDLTGQDMPHSVLSQYISNNWSQAQLQQFAQKDPTLNSTLPWIASGQTFTQTQEAFINQYGAAPSDTATLAGWFRFRQGAQQLGAGRPSTESLSQGAQTRMRDVEVR